MTRQNAKNSKQANSLSDEAQELSQQDLIFAILKEQATDNGFLYTEGVLEVLPDGFVR